MDAEPRSKRLETEHGCSLPEEIVEDILSLLPVKSLARFRCVSPMWDDLITSPEFRKLHSQRSRGKHNSLFLKPRRRREFYAWNLGSPVVETIIDHWRQPQGNIVFPVTKSCHGLVILRSLDYDMYYVWNPSARDILPLPDSTPARVAWRGTDTVTRAVYGMGYCGSTTQQYKVVRMYSLHHGSDTTTVCEVFTLDESTFWRPAATQPTGSVCQLRINGGQGAVLCNGNLHFVQKCGLYRLTVFNVNDETFSTMILPADQWGSCWEYDFMLTELDGCLCAYRKLDHDPYYIWLLKDYEAGKWERLRCIDWGSISETDNAALKSSWITPLEMYYDDKDQKKKKIMFGTGTCKVFVVDPDTGVPEILFSPHDTINQDRFGDCDDSQYPTMGLFEESLVSVGRKSEEIIFSSPSTQGWSEVLMHLPARTVGRLNQVCKGWRAMIKADCFVEAHLYRANLNRSPWIMFADGTPHGFRALEDFINTSNEPPLVDADSRLVCSKPCYGLNVGSFARYDFLCNPVTKYYKAMPLDNGKDLTTSSLDREIKRTPLDYSADGVFAGRLCLGYEPDLCTHILVRLAYKERNTTTRDYKLECMIRLVENRGWVETEPPPRPAADTPPAHASGKIYWIVDQELAPKSSGCEIMMFDLTTLEFHVLEGPPCGNLNGMSIVELDGDVCVVCPRQNTNSIKIWAMNGANTWYVRHFIDLARFWPEYSSEEVTPLAIDPNDGRVLLSTGRALGYYDTKTVDLETIYRLDVNIQGKKFVPILCMDSLVTPRNTKL